MSSERNDWLSSTQRPSLDQDTDQVWIHPARQRLICSHSPLMPFTGQACCRLDLHFFHAKFYSQVFLSTIALTGIVMLEEFLIKNDRLFITLMFETGDSRYSFFQEHLINIMICLKNNFQNLSKNVCL